MLRHYIKMAMRHLLKNKIQNLISIVGLSVGILCFSICLYCSRFISEVDSCFSNKELIADINLCTTRGDLYSGIPATTIEELRKLRFDEVQDFTFTVYPRERSYNVEIKEGKELPYDHLMTMEVDSLFRKVFTPRILQGSCIIRKSKFPQNPKRSVRFSGKRTKRSVQKRKARNTQKAETKVL